MNANSRKMHTVKEVAKFSGVSVRTLRFYDEIGLLAPAFYGDNGYRYYENEQLLTLQQILFYRELGFELTMIKKIMNSPDFDRVAALKSHRKLLEKERARKQELIRTIDKTLAFLEEEIPMNQNEMYLGFDPKKQAEYEKQAIAKWGEPARERIAESKRRTKNWQKADFEKAMSDYDEVHKAFVSAIKRGLKPDDVEVQRLTQKHFDIVSRFWIPNRPSYIGLGETYCDHEDFRKMYDGYDPKLAVYLAAAMKVFAQNKL